MTASIASSVTDRPATHRQRSTARRRRRSIALVCLGPLPIPEVQLKDFLQEQQQPAEDGRIAEERQAREVALQRIVLLPEAMKDRGRGDGEDDKAPDADGGMPARLDQRAAGELERDADP